MNHSLLWAATSGAALALSPLHAQQAFDLGTLVLSGGFGETTLEETGASVSVVTREDLDRSAETRVIDYLARLPGVDIRSRGPLGGLSSITIRGAGQNYVRVLVDGIDVSDMSGVQVAFDFGSLTTSDISRIEVLRGGQSAVYGSEAIGGVINITTRRAEQEGISQFANVEVGSYGTFTGTYGVTADHGATDYALTLSRTVTDGFSAADENAGNSEADGFASTRLSFSLGYDLAEGGRIGLDGFVQSARFDFDESFPISDGSPDEVTYNDSFGLRAYAELQTGPVESTFALTYYDIERDVRGSTTFGPANNLYTGERVGLSYLGVTQIAPAAELRFGLDATRETFSQSGDFGPGAGESDIIGAFAEVAWTPSEDLDLAATLRHDDHSQFGGMTSGRLAGAWQMAPGWILRASAAQSFRAPSLYELYGPFGNATLEPEESRSLDLGIERRFAEDSFLRATLFVNETENLIDLPFIVGSPYIYRQVAGTVERQGVELEFGAALSAAWRVDGSYTYSDGENPTVLTAGNAWNLEFPEHDISLTVTGAVTERLTAAFGVQSVRDRPTLGDYTVANATLTYAVTDAADAYLRVENLFDEEYQQVAGYGTSDRAVYLGLRARF